MSAATKARGAWGDAQPDWVAVLAEECDRSSQGAAAQRIGYSGAVVSQVLSRGYRGSLDAVEQAVRGALMNATVCCPVLGDLGLDLCLQHQKAPYSAHNPLRVALFNACPGCLNRRGGRNG